MRYTLKFSRKKILLSIPIIIILVIAFAIFKYFNPSVGFTYYKPTYLPPSVSIKERRVSLDKYAPPSIEQNFRTVDWVYGIQELRAGNASFDTASIGTAQQDYNPKSIKPTCNLLTSPKGQRYRLCHWIDYGRIDVHQVKFIKEKTYIDSEIPSSIGQQITIREIGQYVDSFKPASPLFIPVLRSAGA